MRWVGGFWKIYLAVTGVLLLFILARLVFESERGELLKLLPIAFIWPLALLHGRGRKALGRIIVGRN
ncbi:hypothetical protein [Permianibacter aggregans]|uniref:Uncharacterized protein n=1 Tax=Permianibacter aggregans TaxID=1510150 RepID=A0A4R6UUQ0_9GAMM|nr:hypothetical protein [Permianibacter aggregans]QGX40351.1 hypothetical protein E2H98_11975 [Permianibacter aggregans]TDQ49523.1 hypothetical protein EV696_104229 [Permianibacter aggregans]